MSPKTTPNAATLSVDRLAAFAGRAKISPATLDKGQLRQIVEVRYSGCGRSTSATSRASRETAEACATDDHVLRAIPSSSASRGLDLVRTRREGGRQKSQTRPLVAGEG